MATATIEGEGGLTRYHFEGDFPTPETIERAYEDADLNRAINALAPGMVVALLVVRDESTAYVTLRLPG